MLARTRGAWSSPRSSIVSILVLLAGCAHAPVVVDPRPQVEAARAACARLLASRGELEAPLRLLPASRQRAIDEALARGEPATAEALARALAADCDTEAQQRADVAKLAGLIEQESRLPAGLVAHFGSLVREGHLARAIICGEGLLQGQPERCEHQLLDRAAKPTVTIEDPRQEPGTRQPRVARGRARRPGAGPASLAVRPESAPAAEAARPELAARPPATPPRKRSYAIPAVVLAAGGAALIAGGVLGGLAQSRYDELDRSCPVRDPSCTRSAIDGGHRMAVAADVLFGVGGAAVATGVVLFVLEAVRGGERREPAQARLLPTLGGVVLQGGF